MKNVLTIIAAIIATHFATAQTIPSYVPANGLVAWYPFKGNATDSSGNGNNCTVYGATPSADRYGNANAAYAFNGNSMIQTILPAAYAPSASVNYSFSFWFYNTNNSSSRILIQCMAGTLGNVSNYDIFNSHQNCASGAMNVSHYGATTSNCSPTSLNLNEWIYIYIAFNQVAQTVDVYKNGTFWFTGAIGNNPPYSGYLTFGNNFQGTTAFGFEGKMDDIGIWNRVLTLSEIAQLYNACSTAPVANSTADGSTTFCAGNSVNLTCNTPNVTYQWKKGSTNINGATNKIYTAKSTGTYKCIVTNACGTATSNSINVTSQPNAAVTITANGSTAFCAGDSVVLNASNPGAGYSIQWYRSNISLQNATALTYTAKQPGSFKIVSKNNSNGCSRISSTTINITVNCRIANPNLTAVQNNIEPLQRTDLDNNTISNAITIYPNPASGSFTFEYQNIEQEGTANLQIINTMGQTVFNKVVTITDGNIQQEVDLGSSLVKGIYVIRLTINGHVCSDSKVMLQ